jgi:hypothetical protein
VIDASHAHHPRKEHSSRRRVVEFCFGFACVFAGLVLPRRGLGPAYVSLLASLGNRLLPSGLGSGVTLDFRLSSDGLEHEPWLLPLNVTALAPPSNLSIPIDVRSLLFVPLACFVALVVATPLGGWRKNARLLVIGVLVLQPLLLLLAALPVLSFLGGTGPVRAFELGTATHTALQILYRALVAPPAMAFALPLFSWWVLLKTSSRTPPGSPGRSAVH